ncbi:MAG: ABC transporter ATP-binding protein [Anaerolineales bacterium]|nr:MAG: ABC transporter ATP-binding protein [Anaerolineales bacterium]
MDKMAIRVQSLTRDFGNVHALDSLSLEVPAGIVFGFLGPNGAGKTTTIRLLLGLLEPTSGQAEVLGYDTRTQGGQIRSQVGALLENNGIYEQMSAEDNLELYGRANLIPAADRRQRIQQLLNEMGLWERRKDLAGSWSRGMKQRLALARAILHHPRLVLLDEPTAGLDVQAAVQVRESLSSLAEREGVTVFLTTHNMAEAEKICTQIAVIRRGRLVALGAPDELRAKAGKLQVIISGGGFSEQVLDMLRKRPDVESVEKQNHQLVIQMHTTPDIPTLVNLLAGEGVQVTEVTQGKASLEETYLLLMEEEK